MAGTLSMLDLSWTLTCRSKCPQLFIVIPSCERYMSATWVLVYSNILLKAQKPIEQRTSWRRLQIDQDFIVYVNKVSLHGYKHVLCLREMFYDYHCLLTRTQLKAMICRWVMRMDRRLLHLILENIRCVSVNNSKAVLSLCQIFAELKAVLRNARINRQRLLYHLFGFEFSVIKSEAPFHLLRE